MYSLLKILVIGLFDSLYVIHTFCLDWCEIKTNRARIRYLQSSYTGYDLGCEYNFTRYEWLSIKILLLNAQCADQVYVLI